ncbi:MAG: cobalt ECF transporter T component CbiQ [bacterium]
MMHFDIDRYANLRSQFHSFDPRAKIVCLLILIFSIVMITDIKVLFIGFISSITLVLICKIPVGFIIKRLKWVLFFVFALLVIIPITSSGNVIFTLSFITVTKQGLILASTISLKALSATLLVFPMISTMPFITFIRALEQLKIPSKLVQMISFIYRYIFVISDELHKTRLSVQSRNVKKKSYFFKNKILGSIIGMIIIRSYERGERIRDAMLSRGYNGKIRTIHSFKLHKLDILKFSLILSWAFILHIFIFIKIFDKVVFV